MSKPASVQSIATIDSHQIPAELDQLRVAYVYVDEAFDALLGDNPKLHDLQQIFNSIIENGFRDPPTWDANLNGGAGGIVEGNGRTTSLKWGQDQGRVPPRGIFALSDGRWVMPMLFGLDARSETAAKRYAIDHNNLVVAGGTFTALDMARMWDTAAYVGYLEDLAKSDNLPLTVDGDDLDLLLQTLAGDFDSASGGTERSHGESQPPSTIPSDNKDIDEEELAKTNCECPSCGFKWWKS